MPVRDEEKTLSFCMIRMYIYESRREVKTLTSKKDGMRHRGCLQRNPGEEARHIFLIVIIKLISAEE
jgi:hypothetical protein